MPITCRSAVLGATLLAFGPHVAAEETVEIGMVDRHIEFTS